MGTGAAPSYCGGGGSGGDDYSRALIPRTPRVVLLKRSKTRTTSNHAVLLAGLLALPVYVHVYDVDHWVSAQHTIRAIAEADVLIGIHGAGLTHTFTLRPTSIIIEVMPEDQGGPNCFLRMAAASGMTHHVMMPPGGSAGAKGVAVDVGEVVRLLQGDLRLPPGT